MQDRTPAAQSTRAGFGWSGNALGQPTAVSDYPLYGLLSTRLSHCTSHFGRNYFYLCSGCVMATDA